LVQGWITELEAAPWAEQVRVVVAGFGTDDGAYGRSNGVEYVRGAREALATVGTSAVGWAGGGAVAGVVRGSVAGAVLPAMTPGVLILDAGVSGPELEQVQALASRPDAGWAVVASGPVPAARWRFVLRPDGHLDTGVLGIGVWVSDEARMNANSL
jgi:hypothetical protein